MVKIRAIFFALMVMPAMIACNNPNEQSSDSSTAVNPAQDTGNGTKMPDTMYDNSNQDSIQ